MPQWTLDQQQAIDARNKDLLVSAAAGSGKTAVLVERIVQLARQGYPLDRMLIVTFTRAAAGEMRERIQARLSREADAGDEAMHRQLGRMENCQISTIHGFCQKVLKEHFEAVGLDPQTRLCDPALQERLYAESAHAALLDMFEQEDADFDRLAHCFEQSDILAMMKELYTFLMSLEDPWGWLEKHIPTPAGDLTDHLWTATLLNDLRLQLHGMEPLLNEMAAMLTHPDRVDGYEKVLHADEATCQELLDAARRGMEPLAAAIDSIAWQRAPASRGLLGNQVQWVEDYKNLRENLKKITQDVKKQAIPSLKDAANDMAAMDPARRGLQKAVRNLHAFFLKAKEELGVMDFNDLEHLTLRILKNPAARQQLAHSFDHLFVDEYQDVSQIQEAIIAALHDDSNLLFMVGDVKQSIYRFRLADPTLFLTKQEVFEKDPSAAQRKIILQKNFRSQPQVLGGVNQVFDHVMRREITEISYDADAQLVPGREEAAQNCLAVEIVMKPEESDVSAEYAACAQLIHEAMEQPIPDPTVEGGFRPCRWRDIAILMPKTRGAGGELAQALKEQGIPVYLEGDEDYFDLPEIHTVMETLKVVDNPLQDLPLLTALSLPCFHLSREELAQIRLADQQKNQPYYAAFQAVCQQESPLGAKCRQARDILNEWRFLKDALPLDQLIWRMLADSGIYRQAGALPGGDNRQGNLRFLCQRAADFAASQGGTLADFLREGESLRQSQDKTTAKLLGESENLVRLMTIHKSKGLEFPVTLVVGLGQPLHIAQKGKLRLHKELGIGLSYVNPEDRITRPTLAMSAIALRKRMEEKAERARLLYVAMTRAREKLILVGQVKKYPDPLWQLPASAYGVYAASSMLDWVCQALWKSEAFPGAQMRISPQFTGYPHSATPWKIRVWGDVIHTVVDNSVDFHKALSHLENQFTAPVDEGVSARLAQADAPRPTPLPLKTSVSALCRPGQAHPWLDWQTEESREDKAAPQWTVAPLTLSPLPEKPAFLQEADDETPTGAQRGTAVHQALSQLDYSRLPMPNGKALYRAVQIQLEEMANAQQLTLVQRQSVRADWLCRFLESDLGLRARNAPQIKREWAFNYRLPGTANTLVQGVIDLCFEEAGGWILADYKTDYYEDPELLKERYAAQLQLYAQALAAITGRPVREIWLFGLRRGDAICIESKENRS